MNKVILAVNAVLVIAVIGLYAMHFGEDKSSPLIEENIVEEIVIIDSAKLVIEEEVVVDTVVQTDELIVVTNNIADEGIAFVDFDKVIKNWSRYKREFEKVEREKRAEQEQQNKVQADGQALEEKYRNYMMSLQNGGLQDPALEKNIESENQRIANVMTHLRTKSNENDIKRMKDSEQMMLNFKKVVKEFAQNNDIRLILATGEMSGTPVLYSTEGADVTTQILKTLNKKYK